MEAGFDNAPPESSTHQVDTAVQNARTTGEEVVAKPAKKKRKRTPMSKRDGNGAGKLLAAISGAEGDSNDAATQSSPTQAQEVSAKEPQKDKGKNKSKCIQFIILS